MIRYHAICNCEACSQIHSWLRIRDNLLDYCISKQRKTFLEVIEREMRVGGLSLSLGTFSRWKGHGVTQNTRLHLPHTESQIQSTFYLEQYYKNTTYIVRAFEFYCVLSSCTVTFETRQVQCRAVFGTFRV